MTLKKQTTTQSESLILPYSFYVLKEKVIYHDLYVLGNLLEELRDHIYAGRSNEDIGNCLFKLGPYYRPETDSTKDTQLALETFFQDLDTALSLFDDAKLCHNVVIQNNEYQVLRLIKLLSSHGEFEEELENFRIRRLKLGEIVFNGIQKLEEKEIPTFQKKNPVYKYHKQEEPGFKQAMKKAITIQCAEEANEFGRSAWEKKLKWQAELWWERATEIEPYSTAKYWSNLAFVRIQLGRYLRSLELGYRSLGEKRIKMAITAAKKSIKIDPHWECGYQQAAEAHLALGPYDHAMEACRILQQAFNTLEAPSETLQNLQKEAKDRALLWCSLGVSPANATIPILLHSALRKLRLAVIESLPLHAESAEENVLNEVGNKIANQLILIHSILQLKYLRRGQWIRECTAAGMDDVYIQQELVQAAKLIPPYVIISCDSLIRMVFLIDPFSLWGLDRLDRAGVSSLPFDAEDPCEDDVISDPAEFTETFKRHTGGIAMTLSELQILRDTVSSPTATSTERDYAPHHLCAFTFIVLHRFLREIQSPLFWLALSRLRDLSMTNCPNLFWAGGEFLGIAIHSALGLDKYDLCSNPEKTLAVLRIPGGIYLAVFEILLSGDRDFHLQKALASLSPTEWSKCVVVDIQSLFSHYLLNLLDGNMRAVKHDNEATYLSYATDILTSVLDGNPDMIDYLRTGATSERLVHFLPLSTSPFGVFLCRQYLHAEERLHSDGKSATTKDIISRIITKWGKLTNKRKSAYRWESLDEKTKRELTSMAPISKLQQAEAKRKGRDLKQEYDDIVTKLPECACCGKGMGLGVVLHNCSSCRITKYCSEVCQQQDWSKHKKICKKIRLSKQGTESGNSVKVPLRDIQQL